MESQPENITEAEEVKILMEASAAKKGREEPKKYARSQLEIVAARQRNVQIGLTATNCLVACLTCLKVFGIL
jgi:hypothetical protein